MTTDTSKQLSDLINVGIIQTTVDPGAWGSGPPMGEYEDQLAREQLSMAFARFRDTDPKPDIVLAPELAVPQGFLPELKTFASSLQCVVIAGTDYAIGSQCRVRNEAVVIVPAGWGTQRSGRRTAQLFVGKTDAPKKEGELLQAQGFAFQGDPTIWLFDAGRFGKAAVAICSDLMDLERHLLYRGRIQRFFIRAYNQDLDSFRHIAESTARTVYCNVVICNTGHFGGSLCISPYFRPWRRTVFRREGAKLFSSDVVGLPVRSLALAQCGTEEHGPDGAQIFKTPPPRLGTGI